MKSINDGKASITEEDLLSMSNLMKGFVYDVLGLTSKSIADDKEQTLHGLMDIVLDMRKEMKEKRDFAASDNLRDALNKLNITIKDAKDGASWSIDE